MASVNTPPVLHSFDITLPWLDRKPPPRPTTVSTELSRRLSGHGLLRKAQPIEIAEHVLWLALSAVFVVMVTSFLVEMLL